MAFPQPEPGYNPDMTLDFANSAYGDNLADAQSEDGFEDAHEHLPTNEQPTSVSANNNFQEISHASLGQVGAQWQQPRMDIGAGSFQDFAHTSMEHTGAQWHELANTSAPHTFQGFPEVSMQQNDAQWQQTGQQAYFPSYRQYKQVLPVEIDNEQSQVKNEQSREREQTVRARNDPAVDLPEEIKVEKETNRISYTDAYHRALNRSAHAPGCSGESIVGAPAATPHFEAPIVSSATDSGKAPAATAAQEQVFAGPDADKDLSKTFVKYRIFHEKATVLRPQTFLAAHRYWIGVLLPNVRPSTVTREDQFMWLKGNRLTTVETVWNVFSTRFIKQDFVLMLGAETLEMDVRMDECDLMNDKIVILRYMDKNDSQAKGREISGALVPKEIEVIDLD